jgi:hypothetical protein
MPRTRIKKGPEKKQHENQVMVLLLDLLVAICDWQDWLSILPVGTFQRQDF